MVIHVEIVLALIGLVIVTGFVGNFLFEKLRIPDVLLLLGAGVLIGQWLGPDTQLLMREFAPYFGAIAIIMILFERVLSFLVVGTILVLVSFAYTRFSGNPTRASTPPGREPSP